MPYVVTEFESTPNPNAVKCWLDHPISLKPESFLNASQASSDVLASALFAEAGVTNVLFNGDWMTVSKPANVAWPTIKAKVSKVLSRAEQRVEGSTTSEAASRDQRTSGSHGG
jgi:hypothetical protein